MVALGDFIEVLHEYVKCLWRCIQLPESDLPVEILQELLQLIICKIPKVCFQFMWGTPTQVMVTRGVWGFPSLPRVGCWAPEGSPSITAI